LSTFRAAHGEPAACDCNAADSLAFLGNVPGNDWKRGRDCSRGPARPADDPPE